MTKEAKYILISEVFNEVGILLFPDQWNKEIIDNHIFEVYKLDKFKGYFISLKNFKALNKDRIESVRSIKKELMHLNEKVGGIPINKMAINSLKEGDHLIFINRYYNEEIIKHCLLDKLLKNGEVAVYIRDGETERQYEFLKIVYSKIVEALHNKVLLGQYLDEDGNFCDLLEGYWFFDDRHILWKTGKITINTKIDGFDYESKIFLKNYKFLITGESLEKFIESEKLVLKSFTNIDELFEVLCKKKNISYEDFKKTPLYGLNKLFFDYYEDIKGYLLPGISLDSFSTHVLNEYPWIFEDISKTPETSEKMIRLLRDRKLWFGEKNAKKQAKLK